MSYYWDMVPAHKCDVLIMKDGKVFAPYADDDDDDREYYPRYQLPFRYRYRPEDDDHFEVWLFVQKVEDTWVWWTTDDYDFHLLPEARTVEEATAAAAATWTMATR